MKKTSDLPHTETVRSQTVKKLLFYMHTWKILKIYDYSRTKTAAILIYSF